MKTICRTVGALVRESRTRFSWIVAALAIVFAVGQGCQTLRELAALRFVDFAIDGVSNARLAGVDVERIRSYQDLTATDVARLGSALARQELPFAFNLHVAAKNPAENNVQARLVRMDWTLLLEDRETVSGILDQNFVIPPGEVTDIPVRVELDLVEFFDKNLQDLVELALSVSGRGGEPKNVKLRAVPTVDTPVGPIEYPQPITIVSRDLGGSGMTSNR